MTRQHALTPNRSCRRGACKSLQVLISLKPPMRILVVDDQKTLGLALCGTLTQLGHEPQLITSSVAALELIRRGDWRMVITDWMMPDMDGIGALPQDPCRQEASVHLHHHGDGPDRSPGKVTGADCWSR